MKRYLLFLALSLNFTLQAQAPQGFNYQATVRNSSGDLIVNTNVYFKFNVMQGSQTSLPVFTEIHYVPTDDLGQVNLVIGQGTAIEGVFSELDWSLGSYYLGIELDTGSGYVAMGTTQLLSVPYALYAENSGNSTPTTPNLETVLAENNSANNQQIKDLQDPTDAQDATTKAYVDTEVLNNNQNIEQVLTQGNNANGLQLKGIADPTEAQDAVTKAYFENNSSNYFNLQYPDGITNETVIITYSNPFEVPSGKNFFINYAQKGVAIDNFDFDFSYPPNMAIGPGQTISNLDTNGFVLGFLTNAGVSPLTINLTSGDFTVPANKLFVYITDNSDYNTDTILINGFNPNPNGADSLGPLILGPESVISCQCVINGYLYEFFSYNSTGSLTDQDGNTYDYLTYGDQVWTVENAEMVTYRDGTPIPQVTDATEWENLTTGAWSYYNNDPTKPRLYNWYAVAGIHDNDENTPNKEFAPEGWHVPSDAEWTTLENYLIANGYNYDGTTAEDKIAKAIASTTGWEIQTSTGVPGNDQSLNNSSGFNAFPNGFRHNYGSFSVEGSVVTFLSSTEHNSDMILGRFLSSNSSYLLSYGTNKQSGFSVRFVRD
ncbi:fibrobacter succinogenes major paralogous domain-containing protein [Flavobacteriaceae bacterium]|nr:fibrobacter succinogenes major paralogous domain-containing protein [Flavobacteriaceae bacterium]